MAVMVIRRARLPAEVSSVGPVPDGAALGRPAGRARSGLQRDRGRGDAAALPDGAAGAPGRGGAGDRAAALARAGHGRAGAAPLRGRRTGRRAVPRPAGAAADGDRRLAGRAGPRGRAVAARGRGRQRGLDDRSAGRVPGGGDRRRGEPGDGAPPLARGRLRLQAADLDAQAQGPGAGRVPGKRARVEALLAMASPEPPPVADLLAELATLIDVPPDLPGLLALLPRADLYLQDEVQAALHPTLTRVWSRKRRRGQRLVEAPGTNAKVTGFGALDWRDGYFHGLTAPGRRAQPFVDQLAAVAARSRARGRLALVLADNLRIHTPAGSLKLRAFLAEHAHDVLLVYTPAYDPAANRIEWLWRVTRRTVTHAHQRPAIADLTTDLADHFVDLGAHPDAVLRHVGSTNAPPPRRDRELIHAACPKSGVEAFSALRRATHAVPPRVC